jgi:hypothetical protein
MPRFELVAYLSAPVSGGAAQHEAVTELSKPEYHRDDPGLLARILDWVNGRLGWLFGGTGNASATLVLLVLLAAVLVFAVARAGTRRSAVRARPVEDDPLRPTASVDHRQAAERYAADGERALALREWLRAAVQTIFDRGILDDTPGRAADEIARQAGRLLPAAARPLAAAAQAFDLVWFGGREATDAHVASGRLAADAVASARIERSTAQRGTGYRVPS